MNIVVTGGTKGIGRAIVQQFARQGGNIAFTARTEEELAQLKSELQEEQPSSTVLCRPTDVSEKQQVQAFADFVRHHWSVIDVLVNNAGIFIPESLHEEQAETFEYTMKTNLFSAYYLTKALLPAMIEQESGHIFNICSTASKIAYPKGGSYCISKHGLLGMTKVLREEMKEHGIRVTAVLPGPTYTQSWEGTPHPEERFMPPGDIARSVWNAYNMSDRTNVDEITLRPPLGDIP